MRRERLRAGGCGRRAGGPRRAGDPAGTRRGRRRTPARPGSRAARRARRARRHVSGSSAPAPTTSAGARRAGEQLGELRDGAAVGRCARARRGAEPRARAASPASAAQSSIGTITSAGPLAGDRLVAGAGDRARARPAGARAGRPRPGYSPASPRSLPARNGSGARWRRSCWPTTHDERRAVDARGGEGADGVAEPGRRVQDRERGLAAPDRPAGRHADDRALVQREHEAEVVRAGRRAAGSRSTRGWRRSR